MHTRGCVCVLYLEEVVLKDVCMYAFISGFGQNTKGVQLTWVFIVLNTCLYFVHLYVAHVATWVSVFSVYN